MDRGKLARLEVQQKKAEAHSGVSDALRADKPRQGLTAKQEAFAQAIAQGMKQIDAFRHAYGTKLGRKAADEHTRASLLASNPKVAQRINQLLRNQIGDRRKLVCASVSS